jgi:hypothetical protein
MGNVTKEEKRYTKRFLVGKYEGKRPPGKKWE